MKNLIKNILSVFISCIAYPLKEKNKLAKLYTFFSKLLYSKENTLEYDSVNNLFWCKHNELYLYSESVPTYKFSLDKTYRAVLKVCCKVYIPKLNDIVIDIGAGVGTETMFFIQKIGEGGKLFNFEASPSTYNRLELLIEKNRVKTCENFNIAVSGKEGEIWIEEIEDHQKAQINNNKKGIEVKAISLDEFIKEEGIIKINFIKVNIEGAEYEMIDGMKDSIKITENIAISCHDFLFEENGRIRNKTLTFLKENGFTTFENNTGHQVVDSWVYGKRI